MIDHIARNAVQCAKCHEVIESKHRHDFVTCKCGAVSVDGGHEYLRRVGDFRNAIDLSEYEEVPNLLQSKGGIYEGIQNLDT